MIPTFCETLIHRRGMNCNALDRRGNHGQQGLNFREDHPGMSKKRSYAALRVVDCDSAGGETDPSCSTIL